MANKRRKQARVPTEGNQGTLSASVTQKQFQARTGASGDNVVFNDIRRCLKYLKTELQNWTKENKQPIEADKHPVSLNLDIQDTLSALRNRIALRGRKVRLTGRQ